MTVTEQLQDITLRERVGLRLTREAVRDARSAPIVDPASPTETCVLPAAVPTTVTVPPASHGAVLPI